MQGDERAAGASLPAVRRARAGAGAALRHDDPDRARGRHALPGRGACRCGSVTSPTPTGRCDRSAASSVSSCRPGIELIGCRGAGDADGGRARDARRLLGGRAAPRPARPRRRRPVSRRCCRAGGARGRADAAASRRSHATTWSSWSSASTCSALAPSGKRSCSTSLPQLRGDAEVIERAMELGGDDLRGPILRASPRSPTGSSSGARRPRDLRPRPGARPRLLHRRDLRGLRPGARARDRWRRALRRPARALRPAAARLRLRAVRGAHARRPGRGEERARERRRP